MSLVTFYNANLLPLLYLQFLLFIVLFCVNLRRFLDEFKGIDKKYFLYIFTMIVILLSIYFTHLGNMPQEKSVILGVAKSFSEGKTDLFFLDKGSPSGIIDPRDPYPYGPFHPFVLGLFFKFLGHDIDVIYPFYAVVASLSIIAFFFLGYHLFKSENFGIFTAFSYFLVYLIGFFEGFISEQADFLILFVSLSLLFMFISYKMNKTSMYALAMLTILLTMEIRFEIAVLFLVFLVGIFVYRFGDMKKITFWLYKILPGLLIFILLSPVFFIHASSHYFYQTSDNIVDRFLAPLSMLQGNIPNLVGEGNFLKGFVYFWTHETPIIFSIFAFIGVVLCFKENRKVALLLSLLFIMNNTVFFLWLLWQSYHARYAFTTITAFIIFMGFGASFIPSVLETRWRRASMIGMVIFLVLVFNVYYGKDIANLSFKKSLNVEGLESELKPFLEETKNREVNIVVIGNQNIIEFLTLKKTANFMKYFLDNFFSPELDKILNEEGISYMTIRDDWRGESFKSHIGMLEEMSKEAAVNRIATNETIKESIRKIFMVNTTDTYFIIQNYDKDKGVIQLAKDIFNLEQVFAGKYVEVYIARV